jgi:hypothetical protein
MIRIYDSGYRGDCRTERCEQIDSISWLAFNYPERFPLIFHCPGETKASPQHMQMRAKEGVRAGVPDIIDLGGIVGLFEMKRLDSKKSKVGPEQKLFLTNSAKAGHFAAIVCGFEQFKLAYADYLSFIAEKRLT